MKAENLAWGCMEGASGGPPSQTLPNHSQRLAQELRNAASTAESSLRLVEYSSEFIALMYICNDNFGIVEISRLPIIQQNLLKRKN